MRYEESKAANTERVVLLGIVWTLILSNESANPNTLNDGSLDLVALFCRTLLVVYYIRR